jgi:uncharacterized protein involved in exopolysaccharide biosynthesis
VFARDDESKVGLDAVRVIETQSRLLQSPNLAHRVVQQLGLAQLGPELNERHWLPDTFFASAAHTKEDQTQWAATRLLSHLSVTSDPLRTYLITVKYSGTDSALAVVITNGFVAEFLRSSGLQTLIQQRASVESALSQLLVRYGDKHPNVTRAKSRLLAMDGLLEKQHRKDPKALLKDAGDNVTQAIGAYPSPNPGLVIGLLLLLGLVVGIAAALWLERNMWVEAFSHYLFDGRTPVDLFHTSES